MDLRNALGAMLALSIQAGLAQAAEPFQPLWSSKVYGDGIGVTGFVHADLDGDGIDELLFTSGSRYFGPADTFSIQRRNKGRNGYRLVYQSQATEASLTGLAVLPATVSSPQRIVTADTGRRLRVYHGRTRELLSDTTAVSSTPRQLALADADNDGRVDLVVLCDDVTILFDPETLERRRRILHGAQSFAIGNIDRDAAVEIVFSNGLVIQQNRRRTKLEWDNTADGFGTRLRLVNLDTDPRLELVSAEDYRYVRAYDADLQSVKWEVGSDYSVLSLEVADLDADGGQEILFGGDYGGLRILRARDGKQVRTIPNSGYDFTDIDVFDTDGDGELELVWGSGANSTGEDILHIVDVATGQEEWRSTDIRPPFTAVDAGDVDGDGVDEVVYASAESESGYSSGIVFVANATTYATKWQTVPGDFGFSSQAVLAVKVADLDGDGAGDIVVGMDEYPATLAVIDGRSHLVRSRWTYPYSSDDPDGFHALAVADVDGDGTLEIVAGDRQRFYVVNSVTGNIKWQSYTFATPALPITRIVTANLDDDAATEIVAEGGGRLVVYDGKSRVNWKASGSDYTALAVQDTDAGTRLLAGTSIGEIVAVDGRTRSETPVGGACDQSISAIGGVRGNHLLFTCAGRLGGFNLLRGLPGWFTEPGDAAMGSNHSLVSYRLDGQERVLVGGNTRVTAFGEPEPPPPP